MALDAERYRLDFLPGVAEKLGFYVYALRDPRDGTIFYVGKGKGDRAFQHARYARSDRGSLLEQKLAHIREIHAADCEVIVEIVRYQLPSEDAAYEVEAAVIDALMHCATADLQNRVSGHGRDTKGWKSLEELRDLAAPPIDIPQELRPCLLIRPRKRFNENRNPSEVEMWEFTRRSWKMARRKYRYAFCVHNGIVRGVWRVTGWDDESDWRPRGRRALLGEPAMDLWPQYVGGYVGHYLPPHGGQLPFTVLR